MRIEMDGKSFKNYADRALSVIKPGSPYAFMECVRIDAGDDGAFLTVNNGDSYISIRMEASVLESGTAYVHHSDIKRVYQLTGNVSIEQEKNRIAFKNNKKICEVANYGFDAVSSIFDAKKTGEFLFEIASEYFLHALSVTDAARAADDQARPVLSGFNFDGKRGCIIACDGYRLHAQKLSFADVDSSMISFNRIVDGFMHSHLRKISKGIAADETFRLYDCESYIRLVGGDFVYCARYIDGDYPNVYGIIPVDSTYSLSLNPKEIASVAKDYLRQKPAKDDNIMYFLREKGRLYAAFASWDYRTADLIESAEDVQGIEDGNAFAMNPQYIADAMAALDADERVMVRGQYKPVDGSCIKPMLFEQSGTEILILPVRANYEKILSVQDFVCRM